MGKRKPITEQALDNMDELMTLGLSGKKISELLHRSEDSVRNYLHIIRDVKEGKEIKVNPKCYARDIVEKWALKNGFPEPKNGFIPTERSIDKNHTSDSGLDQSELMTAINMINIIGVKFHELAEHLYKNYAKEN